MYAKELWRVIMHDGYIILVKIKFGLEIRIVCYEEEIMGGYVIVQINLQHLGKLKKVINGMVIHGK